METTQKTQKAASIPIAEMVDLKAKGVSLAQIGKMAGVSKQAVSQALKRSGLDPDEIKTFTKDRSLILRGKQRLVLSAITPEKVKTMSVRDAAVAAGILIDKQRLLDGESTANVVHFTKIDLSVYQNPQDTTYRPEQVCTSCRVYSAGVEGGLCETCLTDFNARAAEKKAIPAHTTEGGGDGA